MKRTRHSLRLNNNSSTSHQGSKYSTKTRLGGMIKSSERATCSSNPARSRQKADALHTLPREVGHQAGAGSRIAIFTLISVFTKGVGGLFSIVSVRCNNVLTREVHWIGNRVLFLASIVLIDPYISNNFYIKHCL